MIIARTGHAFTTQEDMMPLQGPQLTGPSPERPSPPDSPDIPLPPGPDIPVPPGPDIPPPPAPDSPELRLGPDIPLT